MNREYNYKKDDDVICASTPGNGSELEIGKTYKVKKHKEGFTSVYGIEGGFFETCFKKKTKIGKIKLLDELELINSRPDVNAEKINEIISKVNKMISIIEEM